jgi:hypothetical protein
VWDLANKKILHRLATHAQVRGFSSDGRLLALDHGDWIQLWNVDTNEESWRFKQDSSTIGNFVFSKDGRMLVTQDSNSIFRLMETSTGKTRLQFKAPENQHFNIALSPGSKTLALGCWGFDRHGSADGTVELWDILNGQKLYVFHGHHGWINSVNFSSDGCRLLSGSYDTTALIYEIPAAFRDRSAAMTTLSKQDRSKYWENLADLDAGIAFAALKKLSADPESVSLCRQQLLVPLSPTAEQIQHWIVQLDDDEFAVREQASRDLEQAGLEAQNAAEQMLMTDCSPEVRRRIKELLDTFQRKQLRVHALRTVELLEQIGTGDAIDTLRRLEKKTKDPTLREDVERSLRRLGAIRR